MSPKPLLIALGFVAGALSTGAVVLVLSSGGEQAPRDTSSAQTSSAEKVADSASSDDAEPPGPSEDAAEPLEAPTAAAPAEAAPEADDASADDGSISLAEVLAIAKLKYLLAQPEHASEAADSAQGESAQAESAQGDSATEPSADTEAQALPAPAPALQTVPAAALAKVPVEAAADRVSVAAEGLPEEEQSSDAMLVANVEQPLVEPVVSNTTQQIATLILQVGPNFILTDPSALSGVRTLLGPLNPSERLGALSYRPTSTARRTGAFGLVGHVAPRLDVARWTEGDRLPLSALSSTGKVVVIFSFVDYCPACHQQGFPITRKLEAAFAHRRDVEFVYIQSPFEGYHLNDFSSLRREKQNYNIARPMAQDRVGFDGVPSTMKNFHTAGAPWHIIVDKSGIVRFNDFTRSYDFYERMIRALL